jgi:hypothetical protein
MEKVYKEVLKKKRDIEDKERRVQKNLATLIIIKDITALNTALTYNPGSNNNSNSKGEIIGFNKLVIIIYISSLYYLLNSFIYIEFQPS